MAALAIPMETSAGPSLSRRWVLILAECIRMVLASLLLFSGLTKLRAPYEFLAAIYAYQLTGPLLSLIIATVLPWLEVLIAICLWTKMLYRGAMITSSVLMGVFALVTATAIFRQLDISCGCFSAADKVSYLTLIRSIILLIAAVGGSVLALGTGGALFVRKKVPLRGDR